MLFTRLLSALALLLALGCGPQAPCWTSTHPEEGYIEFVSGAVELVRDKFPEWYNAETPVGVDLKDKDNLAYAIQVGGQETVIINVTQKALDLCTQEDLASILLHEYVHVALWDEINAIADPASRCSHIRHELKANLTTAFAYDELGYSIRMLAMALNLYEHYYFEALVYCEDAIFEDMPAPPGLDWLR